MTSLLSSLSRAADALLPDLARLSFEIAVLAALVALAIWIFRIRSPAARHALWLLVLLKPVVWLPLSSPWTVFSLWAARPALVAPSSVGVVTNSVDSAAVVAESSEGHAVDGTPAAIGVPQSPASWAVLAWVAGILGMAARLLTGLGATLHLRRISDPVSDGPVAQACLAAAARMGTTAPPICLTSATESPLAAGLFRPAILIPHRLADSLSAEQLQLLLMHEIAHVRRLDNLILLVRRLVEAILFFHPAIWICSRQLHIEAERACDDAVLAASGQPTRYADGLARVAESITQPREVPAMNLLAASETHLGARVRRILDPRPAATWLSKAVALATFATIAVACLPSTTVSETVGRVTPPTSDAAHRALHPFVEQAEGMVVAADPNGSVGFIQDRFEVSLRPIAAEEFSRLIPAQPQAQGGYQGPEATVFLLGVKNYRYPKVHIDPASIVMRSTDGRKWSSLAAAQFISDHPLREALFAPDHGAVFSGQEASGYVVFPPLDADVRDVHVTVKDAVLRYDYRGEPVQTVDLAYRFVR